MWFGVCEFGGWRSRGISRLSLQRALVRCLVFVFGVF
jgi:hypothetical protein